MVETGSSSASIAYWGVRKMKLTLVLRALDLSHILGLIDPDAFELHAWTAWLAYLRSIEYLPGPVTHNSSRPPAIDTFL
jgi:hypothetical protein